MICRHEDTARRILTVGGAKRLTQGVGLMFLEIAAGRQDTPA